MKIAITGRIGSGKSEVTSELRKLGAFVLSADEINRELLEDKNYLEVLEKAFPETFKQGAFDKKTLTRIVFSDPIARKKLNSIAHPEILKRILAKSKDKEIVFVEVPLLSMEWAERFDKVWVVESEQELRRKRVANRDGRSQAEIDAIFSSQKEYESIEYSDCTIIKNDGSVKDLKERVREEYNLI